MNKKHVCPCCSQPLLQHFSHHKIYWFCGHCHQEMPDLDNLWETQLSLQHWINKSLTERQQGQESWQKRGKSPYELATQTQDLKTFQIELDKEWRRMAREQAPLSLILLAIELPDYQNADDCQTGKNYLQQVATAIINCLKRPGDLVCSYKKEEFIVMLPQTKAQGALSVAEQILTTVKALEIVPTNSSFSKHPTLSLGVASIIPSPEYSPVMLITATAQARDQAEAEGGDRVVLHEQLLRKTKVVVESQKTLTF